MSMRGHTYTKFGTNPPTEGFWANGSNVTKNIFYLYLLSQVRVQIRPVDGFFTRDSSKDVKSRKDVPFWGLNDVPLNFWG